MRKQQAPCSFLFNNSDILRLFILPPPPSLPPSAELDPTCLPRCKRLLLLRTSLGAILPLRHGRFSLPAESGAPHARSDPPADHRGGRQLRVLQQGPELGKKLTESSGTFHWFHFTSSTQLETGVPLLVGTLNSRPQTVKVNLQEGLLNSLIIHWSTSTLIICYT